MNKSEWLKFIKVSKEAHHIREIFNGTYALIGLPEVQKQFFDRIDHLLTLRIDEHTRTSLENLREDIEDEIETGKMQSLCPVKKPMREPMTRNTHGQKAQLETAMRLLDTMKQELQRVQKIVYELLDEARDVKITQDNINGI